METNYSERWNQLIEIYDTTKSYLAKIAEIDKSNVTNYCRGKYAPKQDVIYRVSSHYGIDPAWLMGYDVPMKKQSEEQNIIDDNGLNEHESKIIALYRMATKEEREMIYSFLKKYDVKE